MHPQGGARVGLRERKKQETRLALSWAAIKLGIERGVDNVRVEDIAAEAGVSLRTFRNYFSGKAEAIAARHLDRAQRVAAALRARPGEEPLWEAIGRAVEEQFALDGQQAGARVPDRQWIEGVRLLLTEPALQGEIFKVNARAQSELAAVVAERTGTDAARDLYPRLVAAAVGAALGTAIEHWLRADPPVPVGPLLREAVDRLAAGLPVP
ncbi:TetR family transcriptional regulator [Streptomyces hoynatensis]|uniref:TetR family transcriptional regulator n=1 Tax=Streptomyces hoynatensis TaxID=1141874 RepID=A0A3A9Z2T3_9ACTN|nr:TetR family transcriptional regulator [Streptomyces hoynatensis]RKN42515.1 TetR family transcriptional regulator [Streptomyces hoynatensis]